MPFINSKISIKINNEQKEEIKKRFGKMAQIIGKSEAWLMVGFEDEYDLYFKGDGQKPAAFVEVSLYGRASSEKYNDMTREICNILNEVLKIDMAQIYVKYEEISSWGWNGSNF